MSNEEINVFSDAFNASLSPISQSRMGFSSEFVLEENIDVADLHTMADLRTVADFLSSPGGSATSSRSDHRGSVDLPDPLPRSHAADQSLTNTTPDSNTTTPGSNTTTAPRQKAKKGQAKNPFPPMWYSTNGVYALQTLYNKILTSPMEKFLRDEGFDVEALFPRRRGVFYRVEDNERKTIKRGYALAYGVMKVHQRILDMRKAGKVVSEATAPHLSAEEIAQVASEIEDDNRGDIGDAAIGVDLGDQSTSEGADQNPNDDATNPTNTSEGLQLQHNVNKRKRSESGTGMPGSKRARQVGPQKSPVPSRVPEAGEKVQVYPLNGTRYIQDRNQSRLERASVNLGSAPQFHVPIVPKESHDLDVPHQVAIQVTPDSSQAAQIRRSLEMLKEYNENPSNVKQTLPKIYTDGPRISGTQERTQYEGQGFTMPPEVQSIVRQLMASIKQIHAHQNNPGADTVLAQIRCAQDRTALMERLCYVLEVHLATRWEEINKIVEDIFPVQMWQKPVVQRYIVSGGSNASKVELDARFE